MSKKKYNSVGNYMKENINEIPENAREVVVKGFKQCEKLQNKRLFKNCKKSKKLSTNKPGDKMKSLRSCVKRKQRWMEKIREQYDKLKNIRWFENCKKNTKFSTRKISNKMITTRPSEYRKQMWVKEHTNYAKDILDSMDKMNSTIQECKDLIMNLNAMKVKGNGGDNIDALTEKVITQSNELEKLLKIYKEVINAALKDTKNLEKPPNQFLRAINLQRMRYDKMNKIYKPLLRNLELLKNRYESIAKKQTF
ncbi:hypothetical protein BDAP_001353 [Binucleata daphniae]